MAVFLFTGSAFSIFLTSPSPCTHSCVLFILVFSPITYSNLIVAAFLDTLKYSANLDIKSLRSLNPKNLISKLVNSFILFKNFFLGINNSAAKRSASLSIKSFKLFSSI